MVIALPDWDVILDADGPWGFLVRCGTPGLWLLRWAAESAEGVEARMVDGKRGGDAAERFDEWAGALHFPDSFRRNWHAFSECISDLDWLPGRARGVLVSDADKLLAREPIQLVTLVEALHEAQLELKREGRLLRFVFQTETEDPLAVFREFGVREWRTS